MGDEVEEGKSMFPGGRAFAGIFVLRVFISLSGGILGGGIRVGFQQNIHQFFRCVLSGLWYLLVAHCQSRGSLVIATGNISDFQTKLCFLRDHLITLDLCKQSLS